MKPHCSKVLLILFVLVFTSSCVTTSSKNYLCDIIQGADNNIEIQKGSNKHGDTSKSDEANLLLDLSIGFISATGKAIKRIFTSEAKSQSKNECSKALKSGS